MARPRPEEPPVTTAQRALQQGIELGGVVQFSSTQPPLEQHHRGQQDDHTDEASPEAGWVAAGVTGLGHARDPQPIPYRRSMADCHRRTRALLDIIDTDSRAAPASSASRIAKTRPPSPRRPSRPLVSAASGPHWIASIQSSWLSANASAESQGKVALLKVRWAPAVHDTASARSVRGAPSRRTRHLAANHAAPLGEVAHALGPNRSAAARPRPPQLRCIDPMCAGLWSCSRRSTVSSASQGNRLRRRGERVGSWTDTCPHTSVDLAADVPQVIEQMHADVQRQARRLRRGDGATGVSATTRSGAHQLPILVSVTIFSESDQARSRTAIAAAGCRRGSERFRRRRRCSFGRLVALLAHLPGPRRPTRPAASESSGALASPRADGRDLVMQVMGGEVVDGVDLSPERIISLVVGEYARRSQVRLESR